MRQTVLLLLLALVALPSFAAAKGGTLTLPDQSDVRMIVDISGSMKDTDPDNLRQPAVRLLAGMLPGNSMAGLWTFGQYVNMLVPFDDVTDKWRQLAIDRSKQINSVALRTNLGKAIEVASDDYYSGGTLKNTHFILLTDGKVDISDDPEVNSAEEKRILQTLLPRLVAEGATFHPVALSSQADAAFLKKLADESGGSFHVADNAEALNLAFLDALNSAVPQEQIPIEGNGFTVDQGVKEFTALIFRGQGATGATSELTLVRPDGQSVSVGTHGDNVRWANEKAYDLITIDKPLPGDWKIQGELGEGSRVTVVSDLKMVVSDIPSTFSADEPINLSVAFFEKSEKIVNPDFLGVVKVSLSITSEDGRSGEKILSGETPPEDGVYGDTIAQLPASGTYRIEVVADGKTFSRKVTADTTFVAPEPPPVAEPAEPAPAPEQSPAAEEPVAPAIASPIDTSAVEQAEPESAPEPANATEEPQAEPVTPVPDTQEEAPEPDQAQDQQPEESDNKWLIWGSAGGGGMLILGLLAWWAIRRKKNQEQTMASAASERETLEDLDESEPEEEVIPELEPEVDAEPEPEETIPEITDEATDASDEEEIPVAETVVEPEAKPEPEPEPAEASADDAQDDDEEFGLEDFDLSEFDDLPDYEEDESGLPSDKNDKGSPADQDPKKQ
ncbi:von Willebrand factor, type A [Marinobacter santoriniensis NKSG1]|uniref:von Willebrand factor, type A n=1 Tax=Marinobacter santoriniensis NKSG1 TaxID=1288826 RepID=M7CTP8_9GAMM|nr:vWA domain-containing protein [Marinobacter santoriniensis]EMP55550.1 von Willebrand factor, type A [Marinobacter santoriniensis NKSG1]